MIHGNIERLLVNPSGSIANFTASESEVPIDMILLNLPNEQPLNP